MNVITVKKMLFAMVLLGTSLARSGVPAGVLGNPLAQDFNGDGYADLAVGVPFEDVNGIEDAGAVNVIYGSPGAGLAIAGNQVWTQDSTGLDDQAETDDSFGSELATGDFNGDGFADLAIGVYETIGEAVHTGAVQVLLGSSTGLTGAGSKIWTQNTSGVPGTAAPYDSFGSSLAAGDFNADGIADLAIGAPGESEFAALKSGAVYLLLGSAPGGLTTAGAQVFNQDMPGSPDSAELQDRFGAFLTSGDFNGDGADDLAVGIPFEEVGGPEDAGAVAVIYGLANVGLTSSGNQFFHQNTSGILGEAQASDHFGLVLAAGDFDGDRIDDLAVSAWHGGGPDRRSNRAGEVNVLYGTVAGLSGRNQLWSQKTVGVLDVAEENDFFGSSLAAGDFDGDAVDDLAIGVPFEDVDEVGDAGAVNVLYGEFRTGLTTAGNQFWHQGLSTIQGDLETDDRLGRAVAAGDFNRDGFSDLVIGVPYDSVGSVRAGAINVLYGQAGTGLTDEGDQMFSQYFLAGDPEEFDSFGLALASTGPNPGSGRGR